MNKGRVRRRFDERFTASRMAKDYVKVYRGLIKGDTLLRAPEPNGAALEATAVH